MDSNKQFEKLFLQEKPAEMIVFLKQGDDPNYATEVSKGVDCTYSHTIKVLDRFKEYGLVEFKKEGRIKLITLTDEGEEIAHDLEGLLRKFDKKDEKTEKSEESEEESEEKSEESEEE